MRSIFGVAAHPYPWLITRPTSSASPGGTPQQVPASAGAPRRGSGANPHFFPGPITPSLGIGRAACRGDPA